VGFPEVSILGSLLFIIYVNNLSLRINYISEPVLFAYDNSATISSRNFEDFCSVSNLVFSHMIKWFVISLVLNLDKTNMMKFRTKNESHSTLYIGYKENYIGVIVNTKFLGFTN
jgi:hypothetical protein